MYDFSPLDTKSILFELSFRAYLIIHTISQAGFIRVTIVCYAIHPISSRLVKIHCLTNGS